MGFRAGTIRTDKFLTNLQRMYGVRTFTWQNLFPVLTQSEEAGYIKTTEKEGYFKGAPEHKDGSPTERNTGAYGKLTYKCIERGISELVTDVDVARAESPIFNLRKDASFRCTHQVQLAMEIDAMVEATGGAISSSSPDHTVTPTNTWDDTSAATPIEDITTGKRMITDAIGAEPNVIFMSTEVEQMLSRHPEIRELIKYTQGADWLKKGGLPPTLLDMRVVKSNVVYNSADVGQTVTNTNIWRRHCIMAFVSPGNPVNFAHMIVWAPRYMRTRTWRDDELEGNVVEIVCSYHAKIVTPDAAYWFQNCIAS